MRYSTFGQAGGLRVSEIALGTANFGTRWGAGAEPAVARQLFDAFAEAGGTFLDSSPNYQFGQSEEVLGDFVKVDRDRFVIATKFTLAAGKSPEVATVGNSRKAIRSSLEQSLRRLGTDHLDLYWCHWPDGVTPTAEIVDTLTDLVRDGKILYGGLSNFPAWQLARAATLAEYRTAGVIAGAQFEYSLVVRDADREVLPAAEALGLGVAVYSPLGGGLLTGKYRAGETGRLQTLGSVIRREDSEQRAATVDHVLATAQRLGSTPTEVSLAWLRRRAREAGTTIVPIIGPRTPEQMTTYLDGTRLELPDEEYASLSEVSKLRKGTPYDEIDDRADVLLGGSAAAFERGRPRA